MWQRDRSCSRQIAARQCGCRRRSAFPEEVREVEITEIGNSRLITPVGQSWSEWFLHGPRVSDDFIDGAATSATARGARAALMRYMLDTESAST